MSQPLSYTPTAKWLHWIMALIWITTWCIGILAVHWRDALNPGHELSFLHKALASTLIFLVGLRIIWRLTHRPPPLPDAMSTFSKRGALIGHFLLYAIALLALPVSGWYWSSVADRPIMVLGLLPLPPLRAPAPELYELAKYIHMWTSWFCGLLVSGHALIALKHRILDKDDVLKGILPRLK